MKASTLLPVAAMVYVLAWVFGLVTAPSRPTDGAAGAVREYFVQHGGAAIAQSLLVHGAAGVALAAIAWSLARSVERARAAVLGLGLAAAAFSLIQVAILLPVAIGADSLSAVAVDQRIAWVDTVDTVKLSALAAFAVISSTAAVSFGLAGRWLVPFAVLLALLLLAGGVSFLVSSSALTGALYVSLPLLLLWVGVVGVTAARHVPEHTVTPAAVRY